MVQVSLISKTTHDLFREYSGVYTSRRAAFRAAKRGANIPVGEHPDDIVFPGTAMGKRYKLDDRNVRLYVFNLVIGVIVIEYHIREDKEAFYDDGIGHQPLHFNAGKPPDKLKKHYYWKK